MASTKNIKRTKKFQALVARLGSEDLAMAAYQAAFGEPEPEVNADVAALVASGFTQEEAEKALGAAAKEAAKPEGVRVMTSKERGEALVAERGLTFTKGRVYGTGALAEAMVRVLKTGKPEVVASSGVGRTKGVLVYREDSGDVALQNLAQPA